MKYHVISMNNGQKYSTLGIRQKLFRSTLQKGM